MKNLLAYIPAIISALIFTWVGALIQKIMTTGLYDIMTGGQNSPGFTILEEYILVGLLIGAGIFCMKRALEKAAEN